MKHLLLPFLLLMLLLSSCNSGRLEWWEVVNAPQKRLEKASGRNDDSRMEKYLFDKMDKLETSTSQYRVESWLESDNRFLVVVNIIGFMATMALVVLAVIGRFKGPETKWLGIALIITVTLVIIISVPYYLFVKNGTVGSSMDISSVLTILGLTVAIPHILAFDPLGTNCFAPAGIVRFAYGGLLPLGMVAGAFVRVIATYASYLFLLVMIVYFGFAIYSCIVSGSGFMRSVLSLLFKIFFIAGTLCIFYQTMPAMVSILSMLMALVAGYFILTMPSRKYEESPSDSSEEEAAPVDYYSPQNMEDMYKMDGDGNEYYRSKSDGRYYKHTWAGFQETDEPD